MNITALCVSMYIKVDKGRNKNVVQARLGQQVAI